MTAASEGHLATFGPPDPAEQPDPDTWIASVSRSFCVAVDHGGNELTFDGRTWSKPVGVDATTYTQQLHTYKNELEAVSCFGRSFCAAVDSSGNAFIYEGRSWSKPVVIGTGVPKGLGFWAVSCASSSFARARQSAAGRSGWRVRRASLGAQLPENAGSPARRVLRSPG